MSISLSYLPYSDPDRNWNFLIMLVPFLFCFSALILKLSGAGRQSCGALIASFWPALSIVSNVTNKYQHEISFEIEESAAEVHKNTVTKLDNGAPKEGGLRFEPVSFVGTYPKQFPRDYVHKKVAALLPFQRA